jgi:hypothetical protein
MDVTTTSIDGVWFRHIPAGGDPNHQADPPGDNRWQRGEVVDALYFGDQEDTVWAEWYRVQAETGLPPERALPRDLWRWRIDLGGIADLSSAAALARLGLPEPEPRHSQHPQFQEIGEALYAKGHSGLLAPSAARPGSCVLCVFRLERLVSGVDPLPPPTTYQKLPIVPRGMRT